MQRKVFVMAAASRRWMFSKFLLSLLGFIFYSWVADDPTTRCLLKIYQKEKNMWAWKVGCLETVRFCPQMFPRPTCTMTMLRVNGWFIIFSNDGQSRPLFRLYKQHTARGAAIAPWVCLLLPSCRPGFESQAHQLCFHQFIKLCNVGKSKINQKRPGFAHF